MAHFARLTAATTMATVLWLAWNAAPGIKPSQEATQANAASPTVSPTSSAKSQPGPAVPADEFYIVSCNDGDTCRAKTKQNATIKIRLAGIDAPETSHSRKKGKSEKAEKTGQPFALDAKDYLNNLVKGKNVRLNIIATDMYDRNLAEIFLGDANINLKLVQEGMAEVYKGKASPGIDVESYQKAEADARSQKRGIWSQSDYQSPYDYRKSKR